jgi:DNA-directed RNA polymerase specialized sigma24 family protein
VGTVKSRIFRAKERLRGFLKDYEGNRPPRT